VDSYLLEKRIGSFSTQERIGTQLLERIKNNQNPLFFQKKRSDLILLNSVRFSVETQQLPSIKYSQTFDIFFNYSILKQPKDLHFLIKIFDLSGNLVITTSTAFCEHPKLINNTIHLFHTPHLRTTKSLVNRRPWSPKST
jgi:hypothetical protein